MKPLHKLIVAVFVGAPFMWRLDWILCGTTQADSYTSADKHANRYTHPDGRPCPIRSLYASQYIFQNGGWV
jgi:hypothetical protein